jgi:hypothetical protein
MGKVVRIPCFHARLETHIEQRTHYKYVRRTFNFIIEGVNMTSAERHAARRKRREIARNEKRRLTIGAYDDYQQVIDANHLIKAAKLSRNGVARKASVQRYFMNLLRNTWDLRNKLKTGISVVQGFICFDICERGKLRHIRSVHFKERVVQRSLCDNVLTPVLSRSLVYDNGASLEGKGIHFAMYRCKRHLQRYYRKYHTNKGWVLLIDFSGYFDNIQHAPIKEMIINNFSDRRVRWLTWQFIKSFGESSLGIGSQVSQIFAVAYPNKIDHYAREVLRLNLSARYMDDSYFIHESREYLQKCLEDLRGKYAELGIILNPRKTQIIPLKRFTFLKVRYELTKTGKVIMKPCRSSFTRQRRKLKSFRHLLDSGKISLEDIRCSYESWRGYHGHLNGYKAIQSMDKLYYDLFGLVPSNKRKRG